MATGIEAAAIVGVGRLLKKPFEDVYNSCTTSVKGFVREWMAAGAVDRIEQTIEDLERIRTIVSRQVSTLSEIYYPARLAYQKKVIVAECVQSISSSKNILITGTAGQGKSVLMRYLAVQELRRGKRVPLFLELRRIDKTTDFDSLLKLHLNIDRTTSHEELLAHLLNRGNLTLFLDGFDEVPREFAMGVRDKLFSLSSKYKTLQFVISSRPGALCAHLQDLPNLGFAEVAELGESDFKPFLRKIGTEDVVLDRLILAIENSSTHVKQLLKTPLMLTLLVLTCGGKQHIPDTLPEFYDSLFRVLAIMHDETKPGYVREMATKLTYSELEQLFECFSFVTRERFDKTSLNPSQFEDSFKAAISYINKNCTAEGFKTDVSETVCLMVREGIDTTFIHKSIQEYYTARFIKSIPDDETSKGIYDLITETRLITWGAEIKFLEQIDTVRYNLFFRKKQVENFLRTCDYKPNARKIITKAGLSRCLSYFHPVKMASKWGLIWADQKQRNFDSIIIFELAVELKIALDKHASQENSTNALSNINSTFLKVAEQYPDFNNEMINVFDRKIKSCLKELHDIATSEGKRKNALLNMLSKPKIS